MNMQATDSTPAEFLLEFRAIQAESIGWTPLENGAYIHQGVPSECPEDNVVLVVGQAEASQEAMNVLWLVC